MKKRTQIQDILDHLKKYEKITSMEAINLYGCTRLSDKIFVLRSRGHNIKTLDTVGTNRYGRVNYATYLYTPK